ncbi:MAG: NlpC/P60 family protein [Bacteroidales bacterium]|nr:NlpC/P60 family protein [Bacteroidales bacterium]
MKQLIYTLLFLLVLTGCSSGRNLTRNAERDVQELLQIANRYIGVRYVFGGTSPERGFDCSGFVQYVYRKIGYSLPRTTRQQATVGKKVRRNNLQPGDLVFFTGSNKNSRNVGHVGIVTEVNRDGQFSFIHVTTRAGVRIDSIEQPHWNARYLTARRVIGRY